MKEENLDESWPNQKNAIEDDTDGIVIGSSRLTNSYVNSVQKDQFTTMSYVNSTQKEQQPSDGSVQKIQMVQPSLESSMIHVQKENQ